MDTVSQLRRVFVAGQLVEYWEDLNVAFGWTREDQQTYLDRGAWVLLFNALLLTEPRSGTEHGS